MHSKGGHESGIVARAPPTRCGPSVLVPSARNVAPTVDPRRPAGRCRGRDAGPRGDPRLRPRARRQRRRLPRNRPARSGSPSASPSAPRPAVGARVGRERRAAGVRVAVGWSGGRPVPRRRAGARPRRAPGRRRHDRPREPARASRCGSTSWRTYCPPCVDEFPLMNGFAARYGDDGLVDPGDRRQGGRGRRRGVRRKPRRDLPARPRHRRLGAGTLGCARPAGPLLDRQGRDHPRRGARRDRAGHHGPRPQDDHAGRRRHAVTAADGPPPISSAADVAAALDALAAAPGPLLVVADFDGTLAVGSRDPAVAVIEPLAQRGLRALARVAWRAARACPRRGAHRAGGGRRRAPGAGRRRRIPRRSRPGARDAGARRARGASPGRHGPGVRRAPPPGRDPGPRASAPSSAPRRGCSSSARARRSRSTSARPTTSRRPARPWSRRSPRSRSVRACSTTAWPTIAAARSSTSDRRHAGGKREAVERLIARHRPRPWSRSATS